MILAARSHAARPIAPQQRPLDRVIDSNLCLILTVIEQRVDVSPRKGKSPLAAAECSSLKQIREDGTVNLVSLMLLLLAPTGPASCIERHDTAQTNLSKPLLKEHEANGKLTLVGLCGSEMILRKACVPGDAFKSVELWGRSEQLERQPRRDAEGWRIETKISCSIGNHADSKRPNSRPHWHGASGLGNVN